METIFEDDFDLDPLLQPAMEAMSYVGSINILDRGDSPAQLVLDKNARSFAQRMADDTKEELEKVMKRVDHIYGTYEYGEALMEGAGKNNMEYLSDIMELEELLRDTVKKRKYQQQVTIFVVGYKNVSDQRLKLLQQVNEFFIENSSTFDEEDLRKGSPDIDLDEVAVKITDSLNTAAELTQRISDLNKEMVEYLTNYAQAKAGNKGRKKLEKALNMAKEDIVTLSEKLMAAQTDLEEKEDKMQQLFKQIEIKTMEATRYKTAAEVAKRNAAGTEALQEELGKKNAELEELKKLVKDMEFEAAQNAYAKEKSDTRLMEAAQANKSDQIQEEIQKAQLSADATKRDLQQLYEKQISDLVKYHQEEIDQLKKQHEAEIRKLTAELEGLVRTNTTASEAARLAKQKVEQQQQLLEQQKQQLDQQILLHQQQQQQFEQERQKEQTVSSLQPPEIVTEKSDDYESAQSDVDAESKLSRQSTRQRSLSASLLGRTRPKDSFVEVVKRSLTDTEHYMNELSRMLSKDSSKVSNKSSGGKKSGAKSRQTSRTDTREEGEAEETSQSRAKSTLEPVQEVTVEFEDAPDLRNEEAWSNIPVQQLPGRFLQYRQLTKKKLDEIEEQMRVNTVKTQKKVNTLKAQFQEHKSKWEQERNILVQQVDQAQRLQTEAEKEADSAMTQLEDFINEQEQLELQETEKQKLSAEKPQAAAAEAPSEQDLQALLQQTDDAKIRNSAAAGRVSTMDNGSRAEVPALTPLPLQEVSKETEEESVNDQTAPPASAQETPKVRDMSSRLSMEKAKTDLGEQFTPTPPKSPRPETVPGIGQGNVSPGRRSRLISRESHKAKNALSVTIFPENEETASQGGMEEEGATAAKHLPPVMEEALESVKEMMIETNLDEVQQKQLNALRSSFMSQHEKEFHLNEEERDRTLAIFGLATQVSTEAIFLGFEPSSIFQTFAKLAAIPLSKLGGDVNVGQKPPQKLYDKATSPFKELTAVKQLQTDEELYRAQEETSEQPSQAPAQEEPKPEDPASTVPETPHDAQHLSDQAANEEVELPKTPASLAPSRMQSDLVPASIHSLTASAAEGAQGGVDSRLSQAHSRVSSGQKRSATPNATRKSVEPSRPDTGADGRMSSQTSSLSQHKAKIAERRQSIDQRRKMSQSIMVTSRPVSELEVDEDGDMPFPEDVKTTLDVGTSPMSLHTKRHMALADHPIVNEYMKTYNGIVKFKDDVAQVLLNKEMLQASQMLSEIEGVLFDRGEKVIPQIEKMTKNVYTLFEEITSLLSSIIINDRGPVVSSILNVSRDPTRTMTRERSSESLRGATRDSQRTIGTKMTPTSADSGNRRIQELEQQYDHLQNLFQDETKKHQDEVNHNQVVMMGMQDTIKELEKELSGLRKSLAQSPGQYSTQLEHPDSAVMFTRLDSDRNSRAMKSAVNDSKLSPDLYKDAVDQMQAYVSLPAQRLAHLVRKFVHHCRMKEIEETVRQSKSLNNEVFQVLDRMETIQNVRAQRWAEKMDEMGNTRLQLAQLLTETLDAIEQESGIFLIKPHYSYRGRPFGHAGYNGPLSKPFKNYLASIRDRQHSAYVPAPTPASNSRSATYRRYGQNPPAADVPVGIPEQRGPVTEGEMLTGSAVNWVGEVPRPVWSMSSSHVKSALESGYPYQTSLVNTPRMLDLDINRMLIGQNQISTKVDSSLSDDRLVNAANTNLRSYVTVNRPSAQPIVTKDKRPRSHTGFVDGSVPPSTPMASVPGSAHDKKVRIAETSDIPTVLPSISPLPPITPREKKTPTPSEQAHQEDLAGHQAPLELPQSAQGASIPPTPADVEERADSPPLAHVTKIVTKTPSAQSNRNFDPDKEEED
ncbi:nuclear mitotic apparatus protein 1 isoform X2 [Lingula anatina]|uniref:Nuclear mitotic apparatus protein 1 isoform X2 n=1 Tax=Lingula anatina TaxID=7574 RepID=A0A1S3K4N9_LINAN|nr:nuclear mitotic apparatus protein 1 isoform X2 [Lingula anatina]|eukprot:XP_013417598.1 nuclear mitotic apparatus protein 1 isoform X2 [Lingula anatina]